MLRRASLWGGRQVLVVVIVYKIHLVCMQNSEPSGTKSKWW